MKSSRGGGDSNGVSQAERASFSGEATSFFSSGLMAVAGGLGGEDGWWSPPSSSMPTGWDRNFASYKAGWGDRSGNVTPLTQKASYPWKKTHQTPGGWLFR